MPFELAKPSSQQEQSTSLPLYLRNTQHLMMNISRIFFLSGKYGILLLCIAGLFCSCLNVRKATYFNNTPADTVINNIGKIPVSFINPSDILSIEVTSLNAQATSILTTGRGATGSSTTYIVDSSGLIQLPFLGNIKASGLTLNQLKQIITRQLVDKELLKEPIVSIHFLNYKITVMGEVRTPSVITVPNEKISILEALGQAGDMTVYAKLNTVLLIREGPQGQKILKRLNLNSASIFTSPYFYLKSGDIIYVEPNSMKANSTNNLTQVLSYVLSGLSLLTIIVQLTRR